MSEYKKHQEEIKEALRRPEQKTVTLTNMDSEIKELKYFSLDAEAALADIERKEVQNVAKVARSMQHRTSSRFEQALGVALELADASNACAIKWAFPAIWEDHLNRATKEKK